MKNKLTVTRLVIAIVTTGLEELAIWAVWRWASIELGIRLSLLPLIMIMVAWAAFAMWLFIFTTWTLKKQGKAGGTSMIGERGTAAGRLAPGGMVKIRGELWKAAAEGGKIEAGEKIEVVGESRLKLTVRKIEGERAGQTRVRNGDAI